MNRTISSVEKNRPNIVFSFGLALVWKKKSLSFHDMTMVTDMRSSR